MYQLKSNELKHYLNDFTKHLLSSGRTERTSVKHLNSLKIILNNIPYLNYPHFSRFIRMKKSIGASESYLNSLIYSARFFSRYLKERGIKIDNKLSSYKQFTTFYGVRTGSLSKSEVRKFMAVQAEKNQPKEDVFKWDAFFAFIAFVGLFPGEAAGLRKDDIDIKKRRVVMKSKQFLDRRILPIPERALLSIKYFYNKSFRGELIFKRKRTLLKENSTNWHYEFHKRLKKIGVTKDESRKRMLTVLSLRNYYIEELMRKEVNLVKIKSSVGHRDFRSTLHYAKRIGVVKKISKKYMSNQEIDKVFAEQG